MKAEQLINFIDCGFNGLMIGKHGTGKTTLIKEVFTEMFGEQGVDWLYFSASTIDPWVDFIGIPKETIADDGTKYLDFVRPKALTTNKVQAIFLDEYNRAHKKVRNATMELIQFKSINGKSFPNLKVVWAAINPHEDEQDDYEETYSVEQLDPAQKDRFEVHINMPYDVDDEFFIKKYGKKIGSGACHYWRNLPEKEKKKVSPRRLDYAIQGLEKGVHIREYIIPSSANITQLNKLISKGSPEMVLENMINTKVSNSTFSEFFKDINNFDGVKELIKNNIEVATKVLKYIPQEQIQALLVDSNKIEKLIFIDRPAQFKELLENMTEFSTQAKMKNKAAYALVHIKNAEKNIPKDLRELDIQVYNSKNISNKISTCEANSLTIDKDKLLNDFANIDINAIPSTHLISTIVTAQNIIKDTNNSFCKKKEIAHVSSALDNNITIDIAKGLLSIANLFCCRSQQKSIISNYDLGLIIATACACFFKSGETPDELMKIISTTYSNIFVRYLSPITKGILTHTSSSDELSAIKSLSLVIK